MYVTAIRAEGLRNAEQLDLRQLEQRVDLAKGPEGIAVADALSLFAASLRPDRTPRGLQELGLAAESDELDVLEEEGLPVQVTLPDPDRVRPLLVRDRRITVGVEIALDPPLYGSLREQALRDPRLVTALGSDASLAVRVGWLFTRDLSTASVSVLEVRVGDVSFPMTERPPWIAKLLHEVGGRFARVRWKENVAERLLEASLSTEAALRDGFERAASACQDPPFELGRLGLVRTTAGIEPRFGPDLLRPRQFGPSADRALALVTAVFLDRPDVLVLEGDGLPLDWLVARTEGDDATLEQIVHAVGGAS